MHYLEDDLDLLDGVPEEVKRQCYEMRDLDVRVEKALADVRDESRAFFGALKSLSGDERTKRCKKIKETYQIIREMGEEKLAIAEFLELMLEKYQERIAKDLNEFKLELEADTPGITDSIEKELCESLRSSHKKPPSKLSSSIGASLSAAVFGDGGGGDDSGFEDVKPSTSAISSINNRIKHRAERSVEDGTKFSTNDESSTSRRKRPTNQASASSGHGQSRNSSLESSVSADSDFLTPPPPKKKSIVPSFSSLNNKHVKTDVKSERKPSRTLGPSSKLTSSASSSVLNVRHAHVNNKEKHQKLIGQYVTSTKLGKVSSSPAISASQPTSWSASTSSPQNNSNYLNPPTTPLSSHRVHHGSQQRPIPHHHNLVQRPSLSIGSNGGKGGSVASSSASTTPSPPTTIIGGGALNNHNNGHVEGGLFGRSGGPASSSQYAYNGNYSQTSGFASASPPAASQSSTSSTAAMTMPAFAGGQESQYGRPVKTSAAASVRDTLWKIPLAPARKAKDVSMRNNNCRTAVLCSPKKMELAVALKNTNKKLTSRVQQMLKDRQAHRVGRNPSTAVGSGPGSVPGGLSSSPNIGGDVRLTHSASSSAANMAATLSEDESRDSNFRRRNDSNSSYRRGRVTMDDDEMSESNVEIALNDGEDEEEELVDSSEEEEEESLSENAEGAVDEEEEDNGDEDSEDQDNRVWCMCQQKSEGDMVACDNKRCPYEWFHYECVGITAPPRGKWYCPECTQNIRRSHSMESR